MRRRPGKRARVESVHRKRSLGGMSRAEVRWGPRFCSTAPPSTPNPSTIRFPRGLRPTASHEKVLYWGSVRRRVLTTE
jgi:hypothetical protein